MKKILFALCLISFSACHKTIPEDDIVLDPAFSIKGSMNGEAFDFSPGADGRYMFTANERLGEEAYTFETNIHAIDGSGPQLGFSLFCEGLNSSEELLLSLPNQTTNLQLDNQDVMMYLQSDEPNMEWEVQGLTYSGPQIAVPYSFPFSYSFFSSQDNCLFGANVMFFLPMTCSYTGSYNPIVLELEDDVITLTPPEFELVASAYTWNINGNNYTTAPGEALNYEMENPIEGLSIFLFAIDNMGAEVPLMQQEMPLFNLEQCSIPMVAARQGFQGGANLVLEYVDNEGTEYRSADLCSLASMQPETSFIEITQLSDFETNENNQPTKKIVFNAQVELYNLNNPLEAPLILELNNASIAFAY